MFSKRENKQSKIANRKSPIRDGFTLMEILLAMAIVAIMSGAILMSLGTQRKKANQNRVVAEFASVIQPILMCRSDGGGINEVADAGDGGTALCDISNDYGFWPSVAGTDFSTTSTGTGFKRDGDFDDGSWFFYVDDGSVRVCCNSASSKCHSLNTGSACNATTPSL